MAERTSMSPAPVDADTNVRGAGVQHTDVRDEHGRSVVGLALLIPVRPLELGLRDAVAGCIAVQDELPHGVLIPLHVSVAVAHRIAEDLARRMVRPVLAESGLFGRGAHIAHSVSAEPGVGIGLRVDVAIMGTEVVVAPAIDSQPGQFPAVVVRAPSDACLSAGVEIQRVVAGIRSADAFTAGWRGTAMRVPSGRSCPGKAALVCVDVELKAGCPLLEVVAAGLVAGGGLGPDEHGEE